jgi:hypothetical protein
VSPRELFDQVDERTGGSRLGGCLLCFAAVATGAVGYAYAPGLGVAGAGTLTGAVALGVAVWAARRREGRSVLSGGSRVAVLLLTPLGVMTWLWFTRPALFWLLLGSTGLAILWRLIRRYRVHERNEAVKPAPAVPAPDEGQGQWEEFRRRARLHHPDDAEQVAELTDPPAPNGVGGMVLRVDLRAAQLLPEDLVRVEQQARRTLRVDHAFTRQVDTDTAELHVYRGTPLGERIGYQWLAANPARDPERVTVAATVTAQPGTLRRRQSVGWFGQTESGKTSGQLALVHSITHVQHIPTHLLVLDNRELDNKGGSELHMLSGLPGVTYRNRSADAWELICRARDIMGDRQRDKGRMGNVQADDEWPHVRLLITEMLGVVQSRPPVDVQDWAVYTRGQFESRPSRDDWRAMLAQGLADIVRAGRDVEVVLDFGAQAGQIEMIPGVLRRMLPQRVLFRVPNHSDIAPVIGDAAGVDAHLIPEWQRGASYLLGEDGRAVFARAAHIADDEFEEAVVAPMRRWGRRLFYVVDGAGVGGGAA